MIIIYIDKEKTPLTPYYDYHFYNKNEALKTIRKTYKAGNTVFYLDIDNDEILKELITLHDMGKMKHIKLKIHYHCENPNYDLVKKHEPWMEKMK